MAAPQPLPADTARRLPRTQRSFPRDLGRAFENLPTEHGFVPLRVYGTLPEGLEGTLFRNGPGLFELFGRRYRHWFEGDGAVSAVRFGPRGAEGAVKLVESAGLLEEREAGRMLYGLSVPPLFRWRSRRRGRQKNTANTNVLMWQDRLFALMEAAGPTELDPETLRTLGETTLDGVVLGAFSAHPHRVASRRATYNFGVRYGRHTFLDLYELPDEGPARRLTSVPLGAPVMLHDFIATERHLVVFVAPARVVVWRALLGVGGMEDLFRWHGDEPTEVLVIPIDRPDEATRIEVDSFWVWHFANAFERSGPSGTEIVVDACRYPDFGTFEDLGAFSRGEAPKTREHGHLHRFVLDPARGRLSGEPLDDDATEFPRVAPRVEGAPHRYVYLQQGALNDGIKKIDLVTGRSQRLPFAAHELPSEAVFVPRPQGAEEDDGWLLTLVYDTRADTSHVAVLDAQRIDDGPLARACFDHRVPLTFHGAFSPG